MNDLKNESIQFVELSDLFNFITPLDNFSKEKIKKEDFYSGELQILATRFLKKNTHLGGVKFSHHKLSRSSNNYNSTIVVINAKDFDLPNHAIVSSFEGGIFKSIKGDFLRFLLHKKTNNSLKIN